MSKRKKKKLIVFLIMIILLLISGASNEQIINYITYGSLDKPKESVKKESEEIEEKEPVYYSYDIDSIPAFSETPYVIIDDNNPSFDMTQDYSESFELYSNLDDLGRCGIAYANIGIDLMPTEKRGEIGMVKPSGWHTIKYDNIETKYLYNRCHLIGYQLTGENANEKNLITCTRSMNTVGMLDFENKVTDYIKRTNNHVLYRVTPMYEGENLLANGVQMEALSVEDNGEGIKYNVFVYNVQDGIEIDYKTGDSKLKGEE